METEIFYTESGDMHNGMVLTGRILTDRNKKAMRGTTWHKTDDFGGRVEKSKEKINEWIANAKLEIEKELAV